MAASQPQHLQRKFGIGQWLNSLSQTDLTVLQEFAVKAYAGELTHPANDDFLALIRIAVRAEGKNKKEVSRHAIHRLKYFIALEELSRHGLIQIQGPMCLVRRALPPVSVTALGEKAGATLFGPRHAL